MRRKHDPVGSGGDLAHRVLSGGDLAANLAGLLYVAHDVTVVQAKLLGHQHDVHAGHPSATRRIEPQGETATVRILREEPPLWIGADRRSERRKRFD